MTDEPSQSATLSRWARARRFWNTHRGLLRDTAKFLGPSARLLTTTEAHTYAYSVSANFLLAFLPFLFLLLVISQRLLPVLPNYEVIQSLVLHYLPAGQWQILNDAERMARRHTVQIFSVLMLSISSSGVFLPLEVALNSIWGFKKNRGYLANQVVSLGLVVACGAVAYLAVVLAGAGHALVDWVVPHTWTWLSSGLFWILLHLFSVPAAMFAFFLVYWILPHGPVPAAQVAPAAFYTGLIGEVFLLLFHVVLRWLSFQDVYASLALPVTLLVWGYCGALVLLFGASLSARGVARLPRLGLSRPAKTA